MDSLEVLTQQRPALPDNDTNGFIGSLFQAGSDPLQPLEKPELVFGIVGPVGVDRKNVCEALERELTQYEYTIHRIRVSQLIQLVPGYENLLTAGADEYRRIDDFMSAGTKIRQESGLGDALAILAISEIARIRGELNLKDGVGKNDPNFAPLLGRQATAYILDSLKHPDEVKTLRAVYGRGFFLVSVYSARESRINSLAERIAFSRMSVQDINACRPEAEKLVNRDEKEEGTKFGQDVLNTFPMADLFIDINSQTKPYRQELSRFCEIIFNNPFIAPTIDEWGMFQADAASWRSLDLSRQVGSAICKNNGTLLAVGCNEVPASGGGLYWGGVGFDGRDYTRGVDEGTRQKNIMVAEMIERISQTITSATDRERLTTLVSKALNGEPDSVLEGIQALNVIEYGRAVHAEMAALSDAARNGFSVQDHTMYVNTFPCHICARHIISSGIKRVVYIQPYPKSLTGRLFSDSASVENADADKVFFQPFSGVAPRIYQFAFELTGKRKNKDGSTVVWSKAKASTKLKRFVFSYVVIENQVITALIPQISKQEGNHG